MIGRTVPGTSYGLAPTLHPKDLRDSTLFYASLAAGSRVVFGQDGRRPQTRRRPTYRASAPGRSDRVSRPSAVILPSFDHLGPNPCYRRSARTGWRPAHRRFPGDHTA